MSAGRGQPPLTAKMAGVVERMGRAGHPPLNAVTPAEAKAAYEKGAGVLELPKPEVARVEDFAVPARDGHAIPARLYAPSAEKLPVLVFFHGGGFTVGSIHTHDTLCRSLSLKSGCAVVSVDYRLAPAHKFPTASNDAWDAVQFVARQGASLGSTAPGSRSAATVPAVRWRRAARSWRGTRACPLPCKSCFTPAWRRTRTPHRMRCLPTARY